MRDYSFPMFPHLVPGTAWRGGMLAHTDVFTLAEAARFASKHAETEITPNDFLRAAGRGQITLRAIVHCRAKVQKFDGGIFCNAGKADEIIIPAGSIPILPVTACQQLAAAGRASWRTFEGVEHIHSVPMRYTQGALIDGEPDFETVPDDCRVTGNDVHALADAFLDLDAPDPQATTLAPVADSASTDAPTPSPVVQAKAKRRTWWDVSSPYIVEVMQAGQYATAKELYRALEAKAGNDSPFEKGIANNRGSLFVREIAKPLSVKTVQNKFGRLRELVQKTAP